MTRPKADTDPWLTDPISRDRVIAKTVVEGIAEMIKLLRGIRADLDESRGLRETIRALDVEVNELRSIVRASAAPPAMPQRRYVKCPVPACVLPSGHRGNCQPSRLQSA